MPYPNPTASQSAAELKAQIAAEREGNGFLVCRVPGGEQFLIPLEADRLTIGRGDGVDLDLEGDDEVSRVHAELERVGEAWVVADDGLSTNGTFVNEERVGARRRLVDKDLIRVGGTGILFRRPAASAREDGPEPTRMSSGSSAARELTETQRKVLVALCRPFAEGDAFATPATNREIAGEIFLSVDAVKGHLRVLFEKFELGELAQNEKRVRLAEAAMRSGAVRPSDLG